MASLTVIDILLLVVMFLSIIIGFGRGLVSEIISLMAMIAAVVIAVCYTTPLANFFTSTTTVQSVVTSTTSAIGASTATPVSYAALAASFAALFVGTLLVGAVVKWFLNLFFKTGILGFGNRMLGGLFGIARGILFVVCILLMLQLTPVAQKQAYQQSEMVPLFQPVVSWLGGMVDPAIASMEVKINESFQSMTNTVTNSME